ncbi:hypothetical protein D9M71_743660 [compost metagenome]
MEGIEREIGQVTDSITKIAEKIDKTNEQITVTANDFSEIASAAEALDEQSKQFIEII